MIEGVSKVQSFLRLRALTSKHNIEGIEGVEGIEGIGILCIDL